MNKARLSSKPVILVVPLDWGLGHATRCIPIIRQLLSNGYEVMLAGEGNTKILLEQEFPGLTYLYLKGYNIRYSTHKWSLPFILAFQLPRLFSLVRKEHKWLQKIIKKNKIDFVLSDNRYGLYHTGIPCIFMTHQLLIKTPLGQWFTRLIQKINYRYINRFDHCWIPDFSATDHNLSGELGHPDKKPQIPYNYIGPLSRFEANNTREQKGDLLILLSGPEPQRTILENIMIDQLKDYKQPVLFIRGLPGNDHIISINTHVRMTDHLPACELQKEMQQASMVISRCGYSTVMDLNRLKKRSVLIPTPGQTEQEYLAGHLTRMGIALCIKQKYFNLLNAIEQSEHFNYHLLEESEGISVNHLIDNILKK